MVLADADPLKVKKAIGIAMSRKKNADVPESKSLKKDGNLKLERFV